MCGSSEVEVSRVNSLSKCVSDLVITPSLNVWIQLFQYALPGGACSFEVSVRYLLRI